MTAVMEDLQALAGERLAKVLGAESGRAILAESLQTLSLARIASPDDLFLLGERLRSNANPIVAACGASLALTAVIRGARTT